MSLHGRRVLITGAAGGLGLETSLALARGGAHVILADRNVPAGEAALRRIHAEAPGSGSEFRPLDLADLSGIRAFARVLISDGEPLDGLINIAGILPPLQRAQTRDGFELKFGINVLGHYALTGLLLEALHRSSAPRVVSISSIVAARAQIDFDDLQAARHYEPQRVYAQAKLACLMYALELHDRAQAAGSPLVSVAAHPGIAQTGIGSDRKEQPHRRIRDWLEGLALLLAMNVFGQSAEQGALPILHAATDPEARGGEYYGPGGFGQFRGRPAPVEPPRPALDVQARRRLWTGMQGLTGVTYAWPTRVVL